jgi:HPt (histidine-containing phosphotransfer) domain-containing protein
MLLRRSTTPEAHVTNMIGAELPVLNTTAFDRTAGYLAPAAIAVYLQTIANDGEALLRALRKTNVLIRTGEELAEATHTLAGNASLFGFERVAALGRSFELAVLSGAPEAVALADKLDIAIEATCLEIQTLLLLAVKV